MKQILISKVVAYAAKTGGGTITKNEVNLLDTGAMAIFTEQGVLVTQGNAATVLDDVKKIYIAIGNQSAPSKSIISVPIPRIRTSFVKQAYVAPVQLVKYIGNDGTIGALNYPTLVEGDEAFIKITDTTSGLRTIGAVDQQEVFRYSTRVLAGDTAAAITNRLITNINADSNRVVNAVSVNSSTGISLTAIGVGTTFSISLDGILMSATIEQPEGTIGASVAMKFGEGTSDQILALEDAYSPERGNTNKIALSQLYYQANTNAVAGTLYDTYTFSWNGSREISLGQQNTYHFDLVVAMVNGGTPQTTFEAIMLEVFSGMGGTSPAETGI